MTIAVRVLVYFVYYLLDFVMLAMMIRAILSWFIQNEENRIVGFLTLVTEPFITPIRALFYKMNWFQQTPLDVSFMATYLILMVVSMLLRVLI